MNINEDFLEKNILLQSIKNQYYFGTIVDHIDLNFFSNTKVTTIFRIILDFYKKHNKHPNLTEIKTLLTTEASIKAFKSVLEDFKGVETDVDIDVLIEQTEEYFKEKAIISSLLSISENFKELTHAEIAKQMQEACSLTIITDIGFDYFKNIDEHIKWLQMDQAKISTGYDFYDDKLKGGFNRNGRALYIWMGGTNSGKSMLLGNLAANCIRQNLCVPIISLEMDEQLYSQRMSCNFSKIEFDELKNEEEKFRQKIEDIKIQNPDAKLVVKEFPPGKLTVNGLDAYLSKLKKKGYKFDIVFLDYITLMRSENTNGLYEAGKRLAEDVRALSYKYGVSFVSVLQANRSGVSGNQPKLDNTSESMGIAHTADFMGTIWREEEDFETNTIRTGIVKNRIGENYGVKILELDKYLRIREVDDIYEEDTKEMNNQIKSSIASMGLEEFIGG